MLPVKIDIVRAIGISGKLYRCAPVKPLRGPLKSFHHTGSFTNSHWHFPVPH